MHKTKKKLFLTFLVISITLIVCMFLVNSLFFLHNTNEIALKNAQNKIKEREKVFNEFIQHSKDTLTAVRELKIFQDYLEGRQSDKKLLENILVSYLKSNSLLKQVRFINKEGFEKLRIDKAEEGDLPYVVPENQLQDKSKSDCFLESKLKKLEEVWFSFQDVNMEEGKIETSNQVTLRAVYPLSVANRFQGILIVSYCMDSYLKNFTDTPLYDMIIYTDKGYTLPHLYHISKNFPKEYKNILASKSYQKQNFISKNLEVPIAGGVNIILQLKETYQIQQEEKVRNQQIISSLFIFVFSLILSILIMRRFSETLLNLDKIQSLNDNLNEASKIAQIGFWEYTKSSKVITCTSKTFKIFKIHTDLDYITVAKVKSFFYKVDQNKLFTEFKKSIKKKRKLYLEFEIAVGQRDIKVIEIRAKHFYDDRGCYIKSVGSIYDISVLKTQKRRLTQSDKILKNLNEGIVLTDERGKILEVNKAYCKITGYSFNELIGENPSIVKSGCHTKSFYKKMWKSIHERGVWSGQIINNRKDGKSFTVVLHINVIKEKGKIKNLIGVYTNISDILEYEKSLREKDLLINEKAKMASMGEMIDSIAHQWKQPLSIITANITNLQMIQEYDTLKVEDINEISNNVIRSSKYMAETIEDFRNFFSTTKIKQISFIEQTIDKTLNLLNSKYRKLNIRVIKNIPNIKIKIYENELFQVLINILNNASDALEDSGIENKLVFIDVSEQNSTVTISIKDNAGGISEEIIDEIFKSRFTTKKHKNGTGIGLYISQRILKESLRGSISATNNEFTYKSKDYKGACFKIVLDKDQ